MTSLRMTAFIYRYRGSNPNHRDNVGLREAMKRQVPLIYFHSIVKGKYLAVLPVFLFGLFQERLEIKYRKFKGQDRLYPKCQGGFSVPCHKLHIEYCMKAGITDEVLLKNVNDMIDFPMFYRKYKQFRMNCGKPLTYHGKFNNDLAIKYPEDAELDIKFLSKQSEDFCVAYFLHHFLDLYKDKTRQSKKMTLGEKRSWARDVMKKVFGNKRPGEILLTGRIKNYYKQAEDFFISPKSQYWLQENIDRAYL